MCRLHKSMNLEQTIAELHTSGEAQEKVETLR